MLKPKSLEIYMCVSHLENRIWIRIRDYIQTQRGFSKDVKHYCEMPAAHLNFASATFTSVDLA